MSSVFVAKNWDLLNHMGMLNNTNVHWYKLILKTYEYNVIKTIIVTKIEMLELMNEWLLCLLGSVSNLIDISSLKNMP